MDSPAQHSDAILAAASRSLADQRAGGRRVTGPPIGRRSAALRWQRRIRQLAVLAIGAVALGIGLDILGHLVGIVLWLLPLAAVAGAGWLLWRGSPPAVPDIAQLSRAPARKLVANAQLWLEARRRELPTNAQPLIRHIGGQLDLLASQLDKIDEQAPAVTQVRALVGEHLPAVVSAYIAVPTPLRAEQNASGSADEQLVASLKLISGEIDSVTRQLAEGALDKLAIETRFLDMKFGAGPEG